MKLKLLNEVTSVAARQTAAAISKLLNQPMEVEITPIAITNIIDDAEALPISISKTEAVVTKSEITGTINGTALFVLPLKSALNLCDVLFHRENNATNSLGEMEKSSILEVGNIVVGNFLTSLSDFSELNSLMHKAPIFFIYPGKKIEEINLEKFYKENLVVRTSFIVKNRRIDGQCVFLFSNRILDE